MPTICHTEICTVKQLFQRNKKNQTNKLTTAITEKKTKQNTSSQPTKKTTKNKNLVGTTLQMRAVEKTSRMIHIERMQLKLWRSRWH